MANQILNDPSAGVNAATYVPQATPDAGDTQVWAAAHLGYGVYEGCTVVIDTSFAMTLGVGTEDGSSTVAVAGGPVRFFVGGQTLPNGDVTYPRVDLVVATVGADVGGLPAAYGSVIQGTPGLVPSWPLIPDGAVVLAAVTVPAGATSIAADNIVDKRMMLAPASLMSTTGISVTDNSSNGIQIAEQGTGNLDISTTSGNLGIYNTTSGAPILIQSYGVIQVDSTFGGTGGLITLTSQGGQSILDRSTTGIGIQESGTGPVSIESNGGGALSTLSTGGTTIVENSANALILHNSGTGNVGIITDSVGGNINLESSGNILLSGGGITLQPLTSPTAPVTLTGSLSTTPTDSHTATTAFGSTFTIGTPITNNLGYDVVASIAVEVTASTGGQITAGVADGGPTADPVTPALTGPVPVITFSQYLPTGFSLLVDTTGTITLGTPVIQVTPV